MIEFSVAENINIYIETESMSIKCKSFLSLIYKNFPAPITNPKNIIRLKVEDKKLPGCNFIKLGEDAFYSNEFLYLKSGHIFKKNKRDIEIIIPSKVKRGRIPFKRLTPGRHISDEIIEPILVIILQEIGISCYHASSVIEENGEAVINIAWRGTGKTNAVLPYVFDRKVLSDDLSLVDEENGILYAYPRPLRLYKYNIKHLNINNSKKLLLHLTSKITPPWQPVKYISLNPDILSTKRYKKKYLNEELSPIRHNEILNKKELFSNITEFEFSYFSATKCLLKIANIL